jgi:acetyl-CoA decarbonylase/synthase complex subunit delta
MRMPFNQKPQVFPGKINTVTIGCGEKAVTLGGENVFPFYSFDAPIENAPKVGVEITDGGFADAAEGIKAYYEGCSSIAEMAKKASEMEGGDFVALSLEGGDPNGANKSVEELVALVKEVGEAIDCPLVIEGCKNVEKDAELLPKVAEVLQGKNVVIMPAKEENYKAVGAAAGLAYGQIVGGESAVDINLAKQLNVVTTQLGVKPENMVMNVGTAAAGYGYEYVVSTMDRVKSAALSQDDAMLQMPIITPVASETWGVKEAVASEEDMPEWGSAEERGISMEVQTAAADLVSGSNAVILRHPQSVATISKLIKELV